MQVNIMRKAFSLLTQQIETAALFSEAPARPACTMLVQHRWLHNGSWLVAGNQRSTVARVSESGLTFGPDLLCSLRSQLSRCT